MAVAFFSCMDEVAVLGNAATVKNERNHMTRTNCFYILRILHAYRLATTAVVGNGKYNSCYIFFTKLFHQMFKLHDVEVAFKRMIAGEITSFKNGYVVCCSTAVFNVSPRGVKVCIADKVFSFSS